MELNHIVAISGGKDSVAMNRELFFDRASGRPLSLAAFHAWVVRAIAGQREQHAALLAALGAREVVPAVPGVVEVAAAP